MLQVNFLRKEQSMRQIKNIAPAVFITDYDSESLSAFKTVVHIQTYTVTFSPHNQHTVPPLRNPVG